MATTTRRRPTVSREERAAQAAAMAEQYRNFRDSLDDDEVAEYAARFDRYSERNALMIVMQDPDATVVHGFHDWKKHGRQVKTDGSAKGKGIQITAYKGAEQATEPTPEGAAGARRSHFGKAYVFDIRHTEPLPATEASDAAGPVAA